jgi:hypothetical protein
VSNYYRNSSWDLVDAVAEQEGGLASLDEELLPESMQNMTSREREQYLELIRQERAEIQAKIRELTEKREEYIAKQRPETAPKDTLDYVMIQALRQQLAAKGFTLNQ